MYLEVLFCVRQLKRQDFIFIFFLLFLFFLSKGNLRDWNPEKIVPVLPAQARGDCDQVCSSLQYCEHQQRNVLRANTEGGRTTSAYDTMC